MGAIRDVLPLYDTFLSHLKCSANTLLAYKQDLSIYREFVFELKNTDIQDFITFMDQRGLSLRSQSRIISSLKAYFKFLKSHPKEASELLQDSENLWNQSYVPRVKPTPPLAIHVDIFEKLYKSCKVSCPFKTMRNQITLLMLFDLGLRVTQLIDLNLQDFDKNEGALRILNKENKKERLIPLSDVLLQCLKSYISKARGHFKRNQDTDSILLNDKGKRPSRIDLWRWLSAWSKAAGLKQTVSPHQFRHGCAVALYKSGADLKSIQELLGHSRIENTKTYQSLIAQQKLKVSLRSIVNNHHPLSQSSFYKSRNSS